MHTRVLTRMPTIRGRAFLVALLVTALAQFVSPLSSSAKPAGQTKPTVVLVHGAWAGPAGWDQVAAMLRQDGYATATPKLDLYSINGDVSILRRTLNSIPGPKIVVGHSYGGVVVSNATYGRSDVLGLVFTAAFLPDRGDSILTLGIGFRPSGSTQHLVIVGLPARTIIDRAYFPRYFAQDLDAATAAELNRQQRPFNLPIIATPSGPVGWHDLPSWYAVSGEDLMIDPAQERWMAHRAGATTIEFDGASHAAGYTRYATEFVALIEQAAQATTG